MLPVTFLPAEWRCASALASTVILVMARAAGARGTAVAVAAGADPQIRRLRAGLACAGLPYCKYCEV